MSTIVFVSGKINNFTIIDLPYIECLSLLVVQSLTAKLGIQILYGKYYVCNKSLYYVKENNAEISG